MEKLLTLLVANDCGGSINLYRNPLDASRWVSRDRTEYPGFWKREPARAWVWARAYGDPNHYLFASSDTWTEADRTWVASVNNRYDTYRKAISAEVGAKGWTYMTGERPGDYPTSGSAMLTDGTWVKTAAGDPNHLYGETVEESRMELPIRDAFTAKPWIASVLLEAGVDWPYDD